MRTLSLIQIVHILLLSCFYNIAVFSQKGNYEAEVYTIDNGLSHTKVTCLYSDSKGYLWIGTEDGLNRYDGYNFTIYRNQPLDSFSLVSNQVFGIAEDKHGNIWFATDNGVSKFIREENKFINYSQRDADNTSISEGLIRAVAIDNAGDVWFKAKGGIDKFDTKSKSFKHYKHYSDPFTFSNTKNSSALCISFDNNLWAGNKDGLFFFDKSLEVFRRYEHIRGYPETLSSNQVRDIFQLDKNSLLVATSKGIDLLKVDRGKVIHLFEDGLKDGKRITGVNTILVDSEGTLWCGTEKGIYIAKCKKVNEYRNTFNDRGNQVKFNSVNSLLEDKYGILWIGTDQGLFKLDLKPKYFRNYGYTEHNSHLFAGSHLGPVYTGKTREVWVGTWGKGLYLLDRIKGRTKNYRITNLSEEGKNYIYALDKYESNKLLIGTREGISGFDLTTKRFFNPSFKSINNAGEHLKTKQVYSIRQFKESLIIGTNHGIFILKDNKLEHFVNDSNDEYSLPVNEVRCLYVNKSGELMVGTFRGLYMMAEPDGKFYQFKMLNNQVVDIKDFEILSITEDTSGDYWLGTENGLIKIIRDTRSIELFTEKDGLPNNRIYSLVPDKNHVWMSTNRGICKINVFTGEIDKYDITDGLQSYEYSFGSSFKSRKGEIFFGGISGLNAFFPDSIHPKSDVPQIEITKIEIHKEGRIYEYNYPQGPIEISPNSDAFTVQFSIMDFTQPLKNSYAYKVENFQDEWIQLGHKNYITFYNIPAGHYTFIVKGANKYNIWNKEGASVELFVKTRFWVSNFAFIIYVFLFLAIVVWGVQYRTKGLRMANMVLKEKDLANREIEKQKEQLTIKNKNITDSLNYAKRIQEAMLPSKKLFKSILPESFVLYKPKDIVSGDFYWINENENKIFVAAVDCTGHGVPGAFMSIIGFELLRNITDVEKVDDAAEILNKLSEGVARTFRKNEPERNSVRDGMDCSFCVIDKETNICNYAGAFNSLYLVRNDNITEIKGDRFAVGSLEEGDERRFKAHQIELQKTDMLYLFTDGYADQFGGADGKKYKYRRFRHLLLNIHRYPVELQYHYLNESIETWRGNLEQVDDILIIGIKPELSCLF